MKNEYSFDSILSSRAKRLKKNADEKPYFENTNDVLGLYKNPSLQTKEKEEEEETEKKTGGVKGMALLKRIYGGACWKGYEQFGMKEKNGRQVPNCIPVANKRLKAKGGCGITSCKTSCKKQVEDAYNRAVDNYTDVVNHLEEHLQEKAGDPLDAKQSKYLKGEIKRINALHLTPAMKVGTGDPLYKVSNPREVQKKAFEIYGKDAIIYKSDKPNKKYQMLDKNTGKWVYFGDPKMEDFTKHLDPERQRNYLNRALNIKGKWRQNIYSPNTLAIMLLW